MFIACLRLAFLIAAFVTSLNVAAATRYWTLTDVQFSDSAIATGYIGYDDLTKKVTDWNIRVTPGLSTAPYASFTYVPANSDAATFKSGHFQFTTQSTLQLTKIYRSNSSVYFLKGKKLFRIKRFTNKFGSNDVNVEFNIVPHQHTCLIQINGENVKYFF